MSRRVTLLLVVATLVVVGLLPLAAMLGESLFANGRLTLDAYAKLFADPRNWASIGNSLVLAGLTTGCATLIGVPLGLLLGKTDLPLRRVLTIVLAIPLLLPPYVLAVCWFNLLARDGVLAQLLPARSVEWLSGSLFGLGGCVWVLASAFLPVVMILTLASLRAVDPRLEEAGRLVARWPAILRHVTLPIILPGILFGATLVFLLALGEIGAPMFLRYPVFPVQTLTQFSAFYDFGAATAAATPLLAVALLVLAFERLYLREKTYRLRPATPGRRMLRLPLGNWRTAAFLVLALASAVIVVLPLLGLVTASLTPSGYREAWPHAAETLGRSLALAATGASLLTVLGFFCAYLIRHRALPLWRAVDTLTLLLFTLPGTVIGVGMIALWNRPATGFLYASVAMLPLAYVAQYTALTSRITLAALANVPHSREEAAQMVGAPWLARVWHVVAPAALPGVAAAWVIGFIFCFRDLGASMLVYPAGLDTLPVRILTLMANGAPSLIAALCVILVTVTLVALAMLGVSLRVSAGRR